MGFRNELEEGVYTTLKNLLDTQREHGTDDFNVYVHDVIQPLIHMNVLSLKWRTVYESYKEHSQNNFDCGELGDWFLDAFK